MEKVFAPQQVEGRIYDMWEQSGAFKPKKDPNKKPFTIVMPPPNITGQLHIGHALDEMPQDVLIRYHRMKGDPTLWVPGTDHAAIATEVKIVEEMKEEGLDKEGRRQRRVSAPRLAVEGEIRRQNRRTTAKRWASPATGSRIAFTMDERCSTRGARSFRQPVRKGSDLPRRPHHQLVPELQDRAFGRGSGVRASRMVILLASSAIPSRTAADRSIVATTRPETMLGDTGGRRQSRRTSATTNLVGKTRRSCR